MKRISKDLSQQSAAHVRKMETKHEKAVYLKAEGFTDKEIAFNLHTTLKSVQSMISKCKAKIKRHTAEAQSQPQPAQVSKHVKPQMAKWEFAVLYHEDGIEIKEIARILETSVASVQSMISKNKKRKSQEEPVKPVELTPVEARAARREILKKKDKIFNNSYFQADKLKGDDYAFDKSIKIDPAYDSSSAIANLSPEKAIVYNNMRRLMIAELDNHPDMKEMFNGDIDNQKKLNKALLNNAFTILYNSVAGNREENIFVNVIYVFDFLSNISGVKHASLFDMLDCKYQELLIGELDEEFGILGDYTNLRKMF